ncbi:hypothetical protein COO91_02006 [Nostoc flagelliforme CCNUN1]|uniref:Uncharacterized protein n=1 Tax=Nostoc flagelliforme CCNUN1 TaxID=2038116 RepID=A0A2K8SMP9_9NOSO|nr:hypothetical protein COO91_02006 [Nostoc flagelliforme CCNUN1]
MPSISGGHCYALLPDQGLFPQLTASRAKASAEYMAIWCLPSICSTLVMDR